MVDEFTATSMAKHISREMNVLMAECGSDAISAEIIYGCFNLVCSSGRGDDYAEQLDVFEDTNGANENER